MYALMNRCLPHQIKDPWLLMDINESNVVLSRYLNDQELFDKAIRSLDESYIYIRSHLDLLERYYKKYEAWKTNFLSQFSDRDAILVKIESNISMSKIKSRGALLP